MRRLPIYFLIDISESMVGEPILEVEKGIATIIQSLKADPTAIETVWTSIIVFAGKAKTLVPLHEIVDFYPPRFPVGSGTSLGQGLKHLMSELDNNIVATSAEQKGDWKPIVFLFTDGVPTDDPQEAIREWEKRWKNRLNLVAVGFGDNADMAVLHNLTSNVLHFSNTDATAYKEFFKWVTDSIQTSSTRIEESATGMELAETASGAISKIDLSKVKEPLGGVDSNFVVFTAMCQNTHSPYLMKYRKETKEFSGIGLDVGSFRLVGAFPLDKSYFELSSDVVTNSRINTNSLSGIPACPCCGNQHAFAMCECGKLLCVGNEKTSVCPWCKQEGQYGASDESGMSVTRAQG